VAERRKPVMHRQTSKHTTEGEECGGGRQGNEEGEGCCPSLGRERQRRRGEPIETAGKKEQMG
jgi:hypothetical protein